MNFIIFDDNSRKELLPFTYTRPVADIRFGIHTFREKWEKLFDHSFSTITESYLQKKFPLNIEDVNILIPGSICPAEGMKKEIGKLEADQQLVFEDQIIAVRLGREQLLKLLENKQKFAENIEKTGFLKQRSLHKPLKINNLWDIFLKNGEAIVSDFEMITKDRKSAKISNTNTLIGKNIFIEEGAIVECAILNSSTGPIYIGKGAEIMEGSIIRGPFALCEGSSVKMGAKIYGPTTIGPFSKVGGEVNNSVIFGYSNKGHDGFLGNSVIGEWCNLGADTNNSNLKNNYGEVKIWSHTQEREIGTGLQFCGLFMGDHSKSGINTMFNTGTVVGVSSNVFGGGFPKKFIPSFSWGGADGTTEFALDKSIEVAQRMYQRRSMSFEQTDQDILEHIFKTTHPQRIINY
jgi:UDP-N-acetylglucosamine diphosphorylase/glucosamine-1-phosphate N-acetyltransferase